MTTDVDPDWTYRWKDIEPGFDPARLLELETAFLLEFLETALESDPDNLEVLLELGELYTLEGRYVEGLTIDRKLVKMLPDNPTVHYNLACSLALTGQKEKALRALEAALRRGFSEFRTLREDDDLASLRDEPEFKNLLDLAKKALS